MRKLRILFVNDEMVMGGVARILITMLEKLDPSEYEIDVLILHPHGELLSELPKHVHRLESTSNFEAVDVNLKEALHHHAWKSVFLKIKLLASMKLGFIERFLKKERVKLALDNNPYDVEIAAKEGFCTLFVAQGKSKRKLNWIHVDYSAQNYSSHHMALMKRNLQKIDHNMAVSLRSAQAYQTLFKVQSIETINNPIDTLKLKQLALEPSPIKFDSTCLNLITVARFHPQKSVDRLILAASNLKKQAIPFHLYLVGSGSLEEELKALVKAQGCEEVITFLGQHKNPLPLIRQADLFILSSLYEGYPTTVIESFFAGTPVLSTDVSGIHEQIQEGLNGWIVKNTQEALSQKLLEVAQDLKGLRDMRSNLVHYDYNNALILKAFNAALKGDKR